MSNNRDNAYPREYYRLWVALMHVQFVLSSLRDIEITKYSIPKQQLHVLALIANKKKPITPSGLALRLIRKNHTISELISRMEQKGLVEKVFDKSKKSILDLNLTEKGEKVYNATRDMSHLAKVFSQLSLQEIEILISSLKKLTSGGIDELKNIYMKGLGDDVWG